MIHKNAVYLEICFARLEAFRKRLSVSYFKKNVLVPGNKLSQLATK